MNRLAFLLASAMLLLAGCKTEEIEELPGAVAPEVTFTIEDDVLDIEKYEIVSFATKVTTDGPVDCSWTINGELVSTTPSMTYAFDKAGSFKVSFTASNEKGSVTKDYTVNVNGISIAAEWSVAQGSVKSLLGNAFRIETTISEGNIGLSQEWILDGAAAGTEGTFLKTFDALGSHTLRYEAENEDGKTVSASWEITVEDLPLEIQFTSTPGKLDVTENEEIEISANVLHGATGLSQEWVLDGVKISSAEKAVLLFDIRTTHTLVYNASNSVSETMSRTWDISVVGLAPFIISDFENMGEVPSWLIGNSNALSVVSNPKVSTTNGSSKVLSDNMSNSTFASSGYVQIKNLNDLVPSSKREKYNCISIKYFLGNNLYYPVLLFNNSNSFKSKPSRINGGTYSNEAGFKALIKTDDWNVFEWDASAFGKDSFKDLEGVQTSIFCNWAGSSISGYDEVTNNRHVYIDEITLTNN